MVLQVGWFFLFLFFYFFISDFCFNGLVNLLFDAYVARVTHFVPLNPFKLIL